jgi:uncharacterized protein (DUF2141 family)
MQYFILLLMLVNWNNPQATTAKEPSAKLDITITELRNSNGRVRIALFNSQQTYDNRDKEKPFRAISVKIEDQRAKATFSEVPYGVYAIIFMHDENNNERMDSNWIGIPNEGFGASNDARGTFGPPEYEDMKFTVNKEGITLNMTATYF